MNLQRTSAFGLSGNKLLLAKVCYSIKAVNNIFFRLKNVLVPPSDGMLIVPDLHATKGTKMCGNNVNHLALITRAWSLCTFVIDLNKVNT